MRSSTHALETDAQLKTDPRAIGFNAYLPKPFVPEKLLNLVGQYLPKSGG
jgi:CheY-like chemotaxis protein